MTLRRILISAFVLFSTVPLFLSLQYMNHYTGEQYHTKVENNLSALALIAKKRILSVVERIEDTSQLVSSRTQMRISLDLFNKTGEEKHRHKVSRILHDAANSVGRLQNASIYDLNGVLVSGTNLTNGNKSLSFFPEQQTDIKLLFEEKALKLSSISPLLLEGRIIGYLKLNLHADFLLDLVEDRSGLGDTGEWLFAVRNEEGDALFAIPLKYEQNAVFNRTVKKENTKIPITQALLGKVKVMRAAPDYRGVPVVAATQYIPRLDWGLVAKIDEAEVNKQVNENNYIIFILECVIAVLAVIIAALLSHSIAKPLVELENHADEIAQGKFEEHPDAGAWREVKELTRHFNFMVRSLNDLNDNLNQKVVERTNELQEANRQLKEYSEKDPLTGLHNRRFLTDRLYEEFKRSADHGSTLSLAILDIDHFKSVNDTWGHAAGDGILKMLANYLIENVRDSDMVVRLGGEEFCMVFPDDNYTHTLAILEQVRKDIESLSYAHDSQAISVTSSFGVARLDLGVDDQEALLHKADLALYQAKQQGRNRVVEYHPDHDQTLG